METCKVKVIRDVPKRLLKPTGFCIVAPLMISIIIGMIIALLLHDVYIRIKKFFTNFYYKREEKIKKYAERFRQWAHKKYTYEHSPSFHDEYMYYKRYLRSAEMELETGKIDAIPNGLKEIAEKSHKDYLTATLAGLSGHK